MDMDLAERGAVQGLKTLAREGLYRLLVASKPITNKQKQKRVMLINLRLGGGDFAPPPPPWVFDDNSKTKGSSVTQFCIPFH